MIELVKKKGGGDKSVVVCWYVGVETTTLHGLDKYRSSPFLDSYPRMIDCYLKYYRMHASESTLVCKCKVDFEQEFWATFDGQSVCDDCKLLDRILHIFSRLDGILQQQRMSEYEIGIRMDYHK